MKQLLFDKTIQLLCQNAAGADAEPIWPGESWRALADGGILQWSIPVEYGGSGLDTAAFLDGNERLASACLTSCFILSQRDAACRRIRDSDNTELCQALLPALAQNQIFATVGISQLTTSRQHTRPAMMARADGASYVLDGVMPWVTGAAHADYLITGAAIEDGKQLLVALPARLPGITIGDPLDLMALSGSLTTEVRCENVKLDRRWLLAGPAEKVLTTSRGGAGGLETSCLALGVAGAAIDYISKEAIARDELRSGADKLERARRRVRAELHALSQMAPPPEAAAALRSSANALVLRATQAALTASKGSGFLKNHPAQRWARHALFFLVWSCPRPAADATLAYLTSGADACP